MVTDQIERETVINAPVDPVWELITEAEHLGRWFGDAGAEIDLRPGGAMVLRWAEDGTSHGRVVAVEPRTRFSYRWARVQGAGRRGAGRGQLDARRVHARTGGRRHAAARRRERLRLARDLEDAARPRTSRATPRAGRLRPASCAPYAERVSV